MRGGDAASKFICSSERFSGEFNVVETSAGEGFRQSFQRQRLIGELPGKTNRTPGGHRMSKWPQITFGARAQLFQQQRNHIFNRVAPPKNHRPGKVGICGHRLDGLNEPAIAAVLQIGGDRIRTGLDLRPREGSTWLHEAEDRAEISAVTAWLMARDGDIALGFGHSDDAVGRAEVDADTHGISSLL